MGGVYRLVRARPGLLDGAKARLIRPHNCDHFGRIWQTCAIFFRNVAKRHGDPDESVVVRTHQASFPYDYTSPIHWHPWDQLTYAASGVMRVHGEESSWLVPPRRAVWVPAETRHAEELHGPATVRTLYFAPGSTHRLPGRCGIVDISPLLHELIVHVSGIGALDRKIPVHARLIGVLFDQLATVSDAPLDLPMPRDPRAQRVAATLRQRPDSNASVDALARRAGASRRTIERLFLLETRMTIGEWRRQLRLLHGVRLLAAGAAVATVALDAGYSSTSAFIAAFKKTFGTTPGRY
jgi:AraC-like DNA-binding protein/quercetin dioxygenase-like cupin family protein